MLQLVCFLLLLCISITSNSNIQEPLNNAEQLAQLHLSKIPHTFIFCNQIPIKFTSRLAYKNIITKWQKKLNAGYEKLLRQIEEETDASLEIIQNYTNNKNILISYHTLYHASIFLPNINRITTQENMDPEILFFLQTTCNKYTHKRNVEFFLIDHIEELTMTFGSDVYGYKVFCNSFFYNKTNVQRYFQTLQTQSTYYYLEPYKTNELRWIETSAILQLGLIDAAAHIHHQTSLLDFVLANYITSPDTQTHISDETYELYINLQRFQATLEAIFQSNNPLECALFLSRKTHTSEKTEGLFKELVRDIASAYHPQSQAMYKTIVENIKNLHKTN